jgi:hypothetical protein
MKYLLTFLLFISLQADAQDCKLIRETDAYTKELRISTGFMQLEGATLSIDANKQEIDFLFSIAGDDKCYTDASVAAIFFEGTKLKVTQRNAGSMNCEGFFHFIFKNGANGPQLLKKMSTQKVAKIIFTGNNKTETTITLSPEQQQILMDLSACMLKDAPTLVK